MPALRNARLVQVSGQGGTDTYEANPQAAGPVKWAEPVPSRRLNAFYNEVRDRATSGQPGEVDLVTRRELWVDNAQPDLDYEQGDVLTFLVRTSGGLEQRTGVVDTIAREDVDGLPGAVRTTVLTLQAT